MSNHYVGRTVVAVGVVAGGLGLSLLVASAAVRLAPTAAPAPCAAADARGYGEVFEGIVVDRWTEFVKSRGPVRTLDQYQFHVVRRWDGYDSPRAYLTHGMYDGWRYPTYEVGQRYLVFAGSHDSPPHTFAIACAPEAAGDDVPALAARLGRPTVVYDGRPRRDAGEWLLNRARMSVQFVHWRLNDGF